MVSTVFSILLFFLFTVLGIIHFNWVLGGKWGFEKALPTNAEGKRVLNPTRLESAMVGIGLILFGLIYLVKSGLLDMNLPIWIIQYGGWVIPSIFVLRAVGDFKYIGFFKRIKKTEFGKMDSKLFSPLCLAIGLIGLLIQIIK